MSVSPFTLIIATDLMVCIFAALDGVLHGNHFTAEGMVLLFKPQQKTPNILQCSF